MKVHNCNKNNNIVVDLCRSNTNKQNKSRPRRPRTAYNFFFQSERKNILLEAMKQKNGRYNIPHNQVMKVLQADRDRPHRKLHGMISFRDLTTRVSSKWRSLDPAVKKVYQDLSARDKIRYRKESVEWRAAQQSSLSSISNDGDHEKHPYPVQSSSAPCLSQMLYGTTPIEKGGESCNFPPSCSSENSDDDISSLLKNSVLYPQVQEGRVRATSSLTTTLPYQAKDVANKNKKEDTFAVLPILEQPTWFTCSTSPIATLHTGENMEPTTKTTENLAYDLTCSSSNLDKLALDLDPDCVTFLISLKEEE